MHIIKSLFPPEKVKYYTNALSAVTESSENSKNLVQTNDTDKSIATIQMRIDSIQFGIG